LLKNNHSYGFGRVDQSLAGFGFVQTRTSSARSCTCDWCRDNSDPSGAKQGEHSTSTDLR